MDSGLNMDDFGIGQEGTSVEDIDPDHHTSAEVDILDYKHQHEAVLDIEKEHNLAFAVVDSSPLHSDYFDTDSYKITY